MTLNRLMGAGLGVMLVASVALGQNAAGQAPKVYVNLPWSRTPSLEQWAAAYPAGARRNPVAGLVAMQCPFLDGGQLGQCDIRSEQPEGMGFAVAARALARTFIGPATDGGKSTRGSFARLNIAFPPELATGARPPAPQTDLLIGPNDQQITAAFPPNARAQNIAYGRASIQCTRDGAGRAGACTVVSEDPAGAGFGQAAMTLAPYLLFSNWSPDGRMTSTTVRVPFAFGREPEGQETVLTLITAVNRGVREKDFATARRAAYQLLTRFPPDQAMRNILNQIAVAASEAGSYPDAVWAIQQAIPISDNKAELYNDLCWLKATRNIEAASAAADCDEALKLAPGRPAYIDSRGFAYLRQGGFDKALADYDAALRGEPRRATALMGRGIAKMRLGDTRGANTDIRAARSISSGVEAQFESFGLKP